MERRQPPATDEGWYVLHDLRRVDWDAWRDADEQQRERAIEDGREFLEAAEALETPADREDADGASACFSILGDGADLMFLHLRPALGDLDVLERQFDRTALAAFTEHTGSYVSVTEASGYTGAEDYFDPDAEADPGMRKYIESRLYPELPDASFVSFYPMDKRRGPEQNWYDLSFEERAEHMASHGEIGREYAGRVSQIISGSIGLDDFEWGVTLFADEPTDVKELLYEMRFDPSSSRFAEFGPFYSGRRFPPSDLDAFLAGERVPTSPPDAEERAHGADAAAGDATADPADALDDQVAAIGAEVPDSGHVVLVRSEADVDALREEVDGLRGNFEHYDTHEGTTVHEDGDGAAVASAWATASAADTASGFLADLTGVTETEVGPVGGSGSSESADDAEAAAPRQSDGGAVAASESESVRASLEEQGIYAGSPHGEDVHALVLYSAADADALAAEVEDLADGFDRYDTHRGTTVYEPTSDDDVERAVVSLWDTADAAETAADYLADLPEVVRQAGEGDGFGTMGMFYTVKPDHREDFLETFADVGELLAEMDGHRQTELYASSDDANELFIASQWDSKEDAMELFRSDAFAETVEWGREVLDGRPRHVFLV